MHNEQFSFFFLCISTHIGGCKRECMESLAFEESNISYFALKAKR